MKGKTHTNTHMILHYPNWWEAGNLPGRLRISRLKGLLVQISLKIPPSFNYSTNKQNTLKIPIIYPFCMEAFHYKMDTDWHQLSGDELRLFCMQNIDALSRSYNPSFLNALWGFLPILWFLQFYDSIILWISGGRFSISIPSSKHYNCHGGLCPKP